MTITAVMQALKTRLEGASPAPNVVYADPKEGASIGEFTTIVLAIAPGITHSWGAEAMGGGSGLAIHRYTVAIYVFVGTRATGLPELHSRALPWGETLMTRLGADVTLSGLVTQIGDPDSNRLFTYTIGPIKWGDGDFFGVKALLPVEEKPVMVLG
jgi:hypothetical protein